ncbi:MAG: metal-dependent hydrolase [bacterium]
MVLVMPLTPYHFGPVSWLGLLFRRYLDLPTFIIASIIIDIEPFLVIVFRLNYPLHGICHTFLGAAFIGVVFAVVMYNLYPWLMKYIPFLKLSHPHPFKKIVMSSICGVVSHILLDSPLYPDILPFYPWQSNPFYHLVSSSTIYTFCTISFIIGFGIYLYLKLTNKSHNV